MTELREATFECTYASSGRLRTAHVRAWDASEAMDLFARELREDGVAERGSISVRGPRNGRSRTAVYPAR